MTPVKKIVIGLGNPGTEYENTYHNVGALAVRALAGDAAWKLHKKAGKALFLYADTGAGLVFIIPSLYMNQSGLAAREALRKFHAAPEALIVAHDESDLPIGDYKIAQGRGAAGHKGVQSIVDAIGTNGFTRLRIGIRDPKEKTRRKAGDFVLQEISARDRAALDALFKALAVKL